MAADAARVVHPISAASPPWSALVIALLFLSAASPTILASAEQRVASDDFQILDDLNAVLSMDRAIKSDSQAMDEAGAALDMVRDSIGQSDDLSPIHGTDNLLSGLSEIETTPPEVIHPRPYQILTNPNEEPPGEVRNCLLYTSPSPRDRG